MSKDRLPAGIYIFKVNNRKSRTRCEICSKLTINNIVLVSLLLTLNIFNILFLLLNLNRSILACLSILILAGKQGASTLSMTHRSVKLTTLSTKKFCFSHDLTIFSASINCANKCNFAV